jgi:hypothetical protein
MKDLVTCSLKPVLIDAKMLIILIKPSLVRCYFLIINSTIDFNNRKSACFLVNKGYLSKCGIIILVRSLIDCTWYLTTPFFDSLMLPTPKNEYDIVKLYL